MEAPSEPKSMNDLSTLPSLLFNAEFSKSLGGTYKGEGDGDGIKNVFLYDLL